MTYQSNIFAGKTALVTGATQGIGAVIANRLASLGARTIAAGLGGRTDVLDPGIEVRVGDVSKQEDVDRLLANLDELDIVINCAGIIRRGDEHDPAVFEQVLAVNLTGTMRVCSAARKLLAKRGGCIVNTDRKSTRLNSSHVK